jgi:hypothetical protein
MLPMRVLVYPQGFTGKKKRKGEKKKLERKKKKRKNLERQLKTEAVEESK